MRNLKFIKSTHLAYCFAMIALSLFLPIPPAMGQVGEVVDDPVEAELEAPVEELEADYEYEAPATYSWVNENNYYEEKVETRNIDETSWEKAIEGLDYSKTIKPKKEKKKKDAPVDSPDLPDIFGDGNFFQWLFRGLLLLAGIFIIVLIVKNMIQMKPAPKDVVIQPHLVEKLDLQHLEENLNTTDLDPLIQRAVAQENYPIAVRLYYLAILKRLSQQQLVVWKKDKTNRDYLRELSLSPLYQPFQKATRDFEWVWYGAGAIRKEEFEQMQRQFQHILSLIPQNNKP